MEILKPYRARIDALDDKLIDLLAERMGIIREVGHLKFAQSIEPVLKDRVDEVRERNAARGASKNVDADFVRALYTLIIDHSCDVEKEIAADLARKKTTPQAGNQ